MNLDNAVPANAESPSLGAARIRALTAALQDLFGLPNATNITGALMSLGALTDGKAAVLPVGKAASPFLRLVGSEASAKDMRLLEDGGAFKVQVNTGSEGSPVWSTLFTMNLTSGNLATAAVTVSAALALTIGGFDANLTHANTDDRTYTFPDVDGTLALIGAGDSFESGTAMLFRQASAPTGWTRTVDAGKTDSVIRVLLNSESLADGGSWTISGLTNAAHTHGPGTLSGSFAPASTFLDNLDGTGSLVVLGTPQGTVTINAGLTDSQTPVISSSGAWRPKHVDTIQATKD